MKLDESTIATLSASLRRIDPNLMKSAGKVSNQHRLWYQGGEPYFDITVEKTEETLTWFQISLRGKVVSWHVSQALVKTGETDEMDVPADVAYYAASKTIRDGAEVNWTLIASVQAILAQRPEDPVLTALSEALADQLAQRSPR